MRRVWSLLLVAALGPASLTAPLPAVGQAAGFPSAPAPVDQVLERARRPAPTAAPPPVTERWVPERRVPVNVGGRVREVIVPGHHERVVTPEQSTAPPLTGHGADGRPVHLPPGERPPAELRQGP